MAYLRRLSLLRWIQAVVLPDAGGAIISSIVIVFFLDTLFLLIGYSLRRIVTAINYSMATENRDRRKILLRLSIWIL